SDESKPELPEGEGVDLVAGKEGEIVSIVTRSGTPKVTAGTLVNEGDVLVEGGVPIMNEDGTVRYYDYCRADADIMLKCTYLLKEELEEQYEQKQYTGNEKKSLFIMFGTKKVKLPTIGKGYETYDVIEEKKQLKLFENYYLPVYIGSDLVREYVVEEKIYSQNEVKKLFEEKIQKFIETLQEKGVQIIEKNVTINKVSGVWKMKVDFQAIEKTGTERKTQLVQVEEEPQQEGEIQE
ncbi:MAG: sporulation protein YqfD, partial [Lachnospiraceae bacterium]|nr:sporulation protein YqfD [Lachnospiraceae bacterium]